ncbi:MAG TPA: hypothetical protein PKW80_09675 [Bacteroidales bacterium]|nr:hypothetical protein [Bacteroidales bacterium]
MKIKFTILSFLFFLPVSLLLAQSDSEWSPVGLTSNGRNEAFGVEVWYQLNKCNGEDVVFIKFINHNNNKVTVEWSDAVFTKDLTWISNKKDNAVKTIVLKGNTTLAGACEDADMQTLVVKIHDFIVNSADFNRFKVASFKVSGDKK